MKRIFCILIGLIFLSGCALTTIRAPKKQVKKELQVPKQPIVERVKEVFKPQPKLEPEPLVTEEKEEIK